MKLSIFTTVTDVEERGDNKADAIRCYSDLADEVVIVDGTSLDGFGSIYMKENEVYTFFVW